MNKNVRDFTKAAGCGAKLNPSDLHQILQSISFKANPNLIVGIESNDDASVYKLGDDLFLVNTVDIVAPIVSDAAIFARIAALNSMSDVYAMGGCPITALSVLIVPCGMDKSLVTEIVNAGNKELEKAGCSLTGGHTLSGDELRFGYAVTGLITDPDKIYKNSTIKAGDKLILTKAIGNGQLAMLSGMNKISAECERKRIDTMLLSNEAASYIMKDFRVSACTDVTGFGLLGHLYEMVKASKNSVHINYKAVPVMDDIYANAKAGAIPPAATTNFNYISSHIVTTLDSEIPLILSDAETSGGFLLSVHRDDAEILLDKLRGSGYIDASIIGTVTYQGSKLYLD